MECNRDKKRGECYYVKVKSLCLTISIMRKNDLTYQCMHESDANGPQTQKAVLSPNNHDHFIVTVHLISPAMVVS